MKAVVCTAWGQYEDLEVQESPLPAIAAGCVRIRVRFAAVSRGTLVMIAGQYQRDLKLPYVPGTEVVGVISEVAPDVDRFAPGDCVAASVDWGGLAEYAVASVHTTYAIPVGLPMAAATAMTVTYPTAYCALAWKARIEPGDTVLVTGAAGGVGMAAVSVAKLLGAAVIAVASTREKASIAKAAGADHVIDLSVDDLYAEVRRITSGRGASVVFDVVGGDQMGTLLKCAAEEGRVLIVGFSSGSAAAIPSNIALVRNLDVMGFNFGRFIGWGRTDERARFEPRVRAAVEFLLRSAANGLLLLPSAPCFPLGQFKQAFREVAERRSTGRVLLEITPSHHPSEEHT